MKKLRFIFIFGVIWGLFGCQKAKDQKSETDLILEEFMFEDLKVPEITEEGVLCSFGKSDSDPSIFMDNRINKGIIKVNGEFIELNAISAEEVKGNKVKKEFESVRYRVFFEGERDLDSASEGGNLLTGTLSILDQKQNTVLNYRVKGLCGC